MRVATSVRTLIWMDKTRCVFVKQTLMYTKARSEGEERRGRDQNQDVHVSDKNAPRRIDRAPLSSRFPASSPNHSEGTLMRRYRCITIQGENKDPNDLFFWNSLFPCNSDTFHKETLGQLAHFWFPNLRYIIRTAPPSLRFDRSGVPKPAVYLSDQNVVETQDIEALENFFLDIEERYGGLRSSKTRKNTLKHIPRFRAVTVDHPEFHEKLDAVKNQPLPKRQAKKKGSTLQTANTSTATILDHFIPFRGVACFTFHGLTSVWIHLLSTTEAEEMQHQIYGKTLDIFWMLRMLAEMRGPVAKEDRPHLVVEFEREDAEGDIADCGFDKLKDWTIFVSPFNLDDCSWLTPLL
jgi:hypothetical protein